MKLEPYKYIAGVSLEVGEPKLIEMNGNPSRRKINSVGLIELDYGSKVYRFDPTGILNELTIECMAIEYQGVTIPFAKLKGYIAEEDDSAFDKYGFCVSPLFGVAFDPEHQPWLTILTKKGVAAWSKI